MSIKITNIHNSHLGTYLFFLTIIIIWGLSWPITKLGLHYLPPLWLGVTRQSIAAAVLFSYLIATRQFCLPSRHDIPVVLSGGVLFAGFFIALINTGLLYVHAGRATILAYTMPFWVIVLSYLLLKRIPSREQLLGFLFGIIGIGVLFNPISFNWSDHNILIGNGLLLLAALCWAIVIIHSKEHQWQGTPLQLAPWQLLIAIVIFGTLALIYEPHIKIIWSVNFIIILLFLGLLASGYGYVGSIIVSTKLPSITTSLGFLGVPITGLIFSAFLLGEKFTWPISLAMILIIIGLGITVLGELRRNKNSHS